MDLTELRRRINSTFRLNGLSLNSEACTYLQGILGPLPDPLVWLDKVIDRVQKQNLSSSLIPKSIIEDAAKECGKGDFESLSDILQFISAFDVPKYEYHCEKKKFLEIKPDSGSTFPIMGPAKWKCRLFKDRYLNLMQRTLHHPLFTPPSIPGMPMPKQSRDVEGIDHKKFTLHPIEFLTGHCQGKSKKSKESVANVIVLGMLTQLKEGKYYIEDPTGAVPLDLTDTKFHTGLYTEQCFVLAEGKFEDGIFSVNAMGLCPPEAQKVTRSYYGNVNFFGGTKTHISKERMGIIERQNEGAMFVLLSDVHLDKPNVLQSLRILFEGYSETPPVAFVLMGNFLAQPHGSKSAVILRDAFKDLAEIIVNYELLVKQSKFVFVPGPNDPGFVHILPRPGFADCICAPLKEKIPSAIFTTNPARIKYCSKEILILREDIVTKMSRNSIYFPTGTENIHEHFVATVLGQGHLCSLPLHVCPIYWPYDHSLYVYPIPDLVVVADSKAEPFTSHTLDALFVNPGSFAKTDFSFKVYTPLDGNKVEDCQLPSADATSSMLTA